MGGGRRAIVLALAISTLWAPTARSAEVNTRAELRTEADWLRTDRNIWMMSRRDSLAANLPTVGVQGYRFLNSFSFNIKAKRPQEYKTVSQRHAYYLALGHTLHRAADVDPKLRCIRFFDAAADVTHTFNVGAVDLWPQVKREVGLSQPVEDFLVSANQDLFARNADIANRLLMSWREPRDPIAPSAAIDALTFDLRMVEFEQSAVQQVLDTKPPPDAVLKALNGNSAAADFAAMWFSGQGGSVDRRRTLRTKWLPAVGIAKFDFAKKDHRVALGQAYVFLLHGYDIAQLKAYRENGTKPSPSCRGVLPPKATSGSVPTTDVKRALFVAHGLHASRQGHPELPVLARVAADAAAEGKNPKDVEIAVSTAQGRAKAKLEELESLGLRYSLDDATLAAVVARATGTESVEAGAASDGLRGGRPEDLAQFHASRAAAFQAIYDRGLADPKFAAALRSTLGDVLVIGPADPVDAYATKAPQFAGEPATQLALAVLQGASDGAGPISTAQITTLLQSQGLAVDTATQAVIDSLKTQKVTDELGALAVAALADKAGFDQRRLNIATIQKLRDGEMGKIDGGFYLASALASAIDPKLGNDVYRTGTAALTILNALQAYDNNVALGGSGMGIGASAVTGNYVGVVLTLFSMHQQQGQSGGPDPLTLQMLTAIRQDIQNLRSEMHQRFDRVDAQLTKIYDRLDVGLSLLQSSVDGIAVDVSATRAQVEGIRADLRRSEHATLLAVQAVSDDVRRALVADCEGWSKVSSDTPIPQATFISCIARLGDAATSAPPYSDTPAGVSLRGSDIAVRLGNEEQRLQRLPWLLAVAERRGSPAIPPVERARIPRVDRWAGASAAYLSLAREWPEQFRRVNLSHLENHIVLPGRRIAAAAAAVGGATSFLDGLSADQSASLDKRAVVLSQGVQILDSQVRAAGDTFGDIHLVACHSGTEPYLKGASLLIPGAIAWPADLQRSRRLPVAPLEWCLYRVGGVAIEGKTYPFIVLRGSATFSISGKSVRKDVAYWGIRSVAPETPPEPWACMNCLVPHGGWDKDPTAWMQAIWSDLLKGTTSSAGQPWAESQPVKWELSSCFEPFLACKKIPQEFKAYEALLARAADQWLYDYLGKQLMPQDTEDGDASALLIAEVAYISAPRETSGSDLLAALLNGSAPTLRADTLQRFRDGGVPAAQLIKVGRDRANGVRGLTERALDARTATGSPSLDPSFAELLAAAEALLNEGLEECRTGIRGPLTCDSSAN